MSLLNLRQQLLYPSLQSQRSAGAPLLGGSAMWISHWFGRFGCNLNSIKQRTCAVPQLPCKQRTFAKLLFLHRHCQNDLVAGLRALHAQAMQRALGPPSTPSCPKQAAGHGWTLKAPLVKQRCIRNICIQLLHATHRNDSCCVSSQGRDSRKATKCLADFRLSASLRKCMRRHRK